MPWRAAAIALAGLLATALPSGAHQDQAAGLSAPTVVRTFLTVLCRLPEADALAWWTSQPLSEEELHAYLATSPEGQRVRDVRYAYLTTLGRDPADGDCGGLRAWADSPLDTGQIQRALAASPEGERVNEVRAAFRAALGRDPLGADNLNLRRWMATGLAGPELVEAVRQVRPLAGVHYFPWYLRTEQGWGNGNTLVRTQAVGRPAAGFYDSGDPAVIRRHIQQMEDAGFDFVVLNVPTQQPRLRANVDRFFEALTGRRLKAVLMLDDLYDASQAAKRQAIAETLDRYASHPNYLRRDGLPVLYLFATLVDFPTPGAQVHDVYWTRQYDQGKNTFNEHAFLLPQDVPFWAETPPPLVNGVVAVMPGYTDAHLSREAPMEHDRAGGDLYRRQWEHALAARPDTVLVYSWNEHFEETGIEPTDAWGDLYLGLTACYIAHLRAGATTAACP